MRRHVTDSTKGRGSRDLNFNSHQARKKRRFEHDSNQDQPNDAAYWDRLAAGPTDARQPSNSRSPSPAKSDHPSDAEGVSDLDDSEREVYIASRRRARMDRAAQERRDELEERRLARIKAIDEAQPDLSPAEIRLTKDLFDLMLRTAAALHSAANPRQLEGKILANHGGDPRFSFLRQQATGTVGSVWEKLRQGVPLSWADVDPQRDAQSATKPSGLLTGYDSDSSSKGTQPGDNDAHDKPLAADSPPRPPEEDDAAARKKAARLERARAWAASRKQAGAEGAQEARDDEKSTDGDGDLLLDLEAEERDQQKLDAWQGDEERIRIG